MLVDPPGIGRLAGVLDHAADVRRRPLRQRDRLVGDPLAGEAAPGLLSDGDDDVGAPAREVVVEEVAGDVGAGGDLIEREVRQAALGDHRHRCGDELPAAGGAGESPRTPFGRRGLGCFGRWRHRPAMVAGIAALFTKIQLDIPSIAAVGWLLRPSRPASRPVALD